MRIRITLLNLFLLILLVSCSNDNDLIGRWYKVGEKVNKDHYIGFEESIAVWSNGEKKTIVPIQYIKKDQDNVWQIDAMTEGESYKPLLLIKMLNKNRILFSSLRNRHSFEMIRM